MIIIITQHDFGKYPHSAGWILVNYTHVNKIVGNRLLKKEDGLLKAKYKKTRLEWD